MNDPSRRENEHFENEVLRIARARWPSAAFSGAMIIDGREVDGVFDTEECVHVIEATTSRKRDKAKDDIEKLTKSLDRLQATSGTRAVRGWFITRDEPTADQRRVADKHRSIINTLSFSQFQMAIVDSKAYLRARDDYPFGSVRDPAPKPSSRPRRLVPDVLGVLRSEGLAIPDKMRGTVVWRPNRSDRARIGRMISAPTELCDSVLERCSSL